MPLDKAIPIAVINETMNAVSGGIACVVHTLNELADRGYDVRCYVTQPDTAHDWLFCRFPILPLSDHRDFDGIAVATYSPVARAVWELPAAREKFFWVHSYEPYFPAVTPKPSGWAEESREALRLPLKKFADASWVRAVIRYVYGQPCIPVLVPGGVDISVFRPTQKDNKVPVIAFLSRPEPFRGTADILQSLQLLRAENVDFRAWAMGLPVDGADHVRHLPQPEYAARLAQADIFIHASRFEGLPLPPLEAMAVGAVVVATYPGAADYLCDGVNACVVPPEMPEAIALRCKWLLENERERRRISLMAWSYVRGTHTWQHTADRFLAAIEEGMRYG